MSELDSIVVACREADGIVRAINDVNQALPSELRRKFGDIVSDYLARFGLEGAAEKMMNRSVAQIFAEYQSGDVKALASGEIDGVKYSVYGPPTGDETVGGPQNGEAIKRGTG